jgi:orotidine-5'-phosphate decarboxylase
MTRKELIAQISLKKSFLTIGLDTDIEKIPSHLLGFDDPVFEFNKQIIDATHHLCVSYKINTAFYESRGLLGWTSLIKTINYIPKDIFTIADAKRGDIGNTSAMYAKAFFDKQSSDMDFDSVTVAPYMGQDSVQPFLDFDHKWVILLALTSNQSAQDFQLLSYQNEELFKTVIKKSQEWGTDENLMFVVGATKAKSFVEIRALAPQHFLLVPGVGSQGGSLSDVCKYGITKDCGLLVNSSRAIIYASKNEDFAEAAQKEAKKLQQEMQAELTKINFL